MDLNQLNSMKVADLKKELKSRGLSIVGNKSELISRLKSTLTAGETNSNEDSVLNEEDEILGSDLLDGGSEGDTKTDEALIDDLLDNGSENHLLGNKPKSQTVINKRITAAAAITAANDNKTEESPKDKNLTISLSKASNSMELTAEERKEMRALKFGDNKLSARAQRFGLTTESDSNEAKTVSSTDSSNLNERLKKRAERFGVVSDKLKIIENKEKLLKRKERFGAITTTSTKTDIVSPNAKKPIISSSKDEDRKRQRLERFGVVS